MNYLCLILHSGCWKWRYYTSTRRASTFTSTQSYSFTFSWTATSTSTIRIEGTKNWSVFNSFWLWLSTSPFSPLPLLLDHLSLLFLLSSFCLPFCVFPRDQVCFLRFVLNGTSMTEFFARETDFVALIGEALSIAVQKKYILYYSVMVAHVEEVTTTNITWVLVYISQEVQFLTFFFTMQSDNFHLNSHQRNCSNKSAVCHSSSSVCILSNLGPNGRVFKK